MLLTCTLCQLSNLFKANRKFSISISVPFQFRWRPILLPSYFGLIFELLIKQIFLLRHSFLRCQFTSIALSLSLRDIIPETNTLLLSDLHNKATSMMSLLISLALFSFFRSFVQQCRIFSVLRDLVRFHIHCISPTKMFGYYFAAFNRQFPTFDVFYQRIIEYHCYMKFLLCFIFLNSSFLYALYWSFCFRQSLVFTFFSRGMFFWGQMAYLGNDNDIIPFRYITISKRFISIW